MGLGDSHHLPVVTETLATQGSLGGGVGVTRSLWGPPAHPHPKLLGNGKCRRGGNLTSPAWHRSCRLGGRVPLRNLGGQRIHVALARRLSLPGDAPAAESHPRPLRATRAMTAGLHCALCTKRPCGTPQHPTAPRSHVGFPTIAASPGRRLKPCHAPSPPAIHECHAGQDPSHSPGGPARTRGTRSQTAASHPTGSWGGSDTHLLLKHDTASSSHPAYLGEPGMAPPRRGPGGLTCWQPTAPVWGGHSIAPRPQRRQTCASPPQKPKKTERGMNNKSSDQ